MRVAALLLQIALWPQPVVAALRTGTCTGAVSSLSSTFPNGSGISIPSAAIRSWYAIHRNAGADQKSMKGRCN